MILLLLLSLLNNNNVNQSFKYLEGKDGILHKKSGGH